MSAPADTRTDAASAVHDVVLTGGRVLDPANGIDGRYDVAVSDGRISAVAPTIDGPATERIDCTGRLVLPGLVEGHTHIFEKVSKVGANPVEAHLRRGVVAAADAGTAGASTFDAFKKFVVEPSGMRILSFLNVSVLGLIDFRFGELLNPDTLVPEDALQVAAENPDIVRGFKIRLSTDVVPAEQWRPLLEKSLAIGEQAGLPLMVHIGETPEPLAEVLPYLRPGDIVAHCYTGKEYNILEGGAVQPAVAEARARGVLFDSAHGKSNLSYDVARPAIAAGFLPDIASSDTSGRNWRGPVFDLLTSLSKLVALGAPLPEIVKRATIDPARLLGIADEGYGALTVGNPAHVTVVEEVGEQVLPDAAGNSIVAPRFEPVTVLHAGAPVELVPWRGLGA